MPILRDVGFLVAALALAACNSTPPKQEPKAHHSPSSFAEVKVNDIVPLLDGGAYAHGITGGMWYLSGTKASRVRVTGDSVARARFDSGFLFEIQPTLDGGAYAFDLRGGVWKLESDSALPVIEIPNTLRTSSIVPDARVSGFGWALYVHERNERKRAELRLEESEDDRY